MTITKINAIEGGSVVVRSNNLKMNVTPSAATEGKLVKFSDSDNQTLGRVNVIFNTAGDQNMRYITQRQVNGSWAYNILNLGLDSSGNALVSISGTNAAAKWRSAIDAAASSHSHTGMMTYTNYGQTKKNLNDLNANGFYSCFNPTNAPIANSWVNVMVTRFDNNSGYATQIAWTSTPAVYYRTCSGGSWGSWKRFTLT